MEKPEQKELRGRIEGEIDKRGAITFERFMERALYEPEIGYYACAPRVGKRGDFYTSPSAHRAFGETIARVAGALRERLGGAADIVEAGGGDGTLANDILSALARTDPETYNSVKYTLVERRGPERCVARGHKNFRRVKNFDEAGRTEGLIFSNELFDALPFHRLVFRGGKVREIMVSRGFGETENEPSSPNLAGYFDRCGGVEAMGFAEGQQFEVCLAAAEIMKSMAQTLQKGIILTIDYGFQTDELYSPDRKTGTFKCVSGHRISESPYENIGEQDITAHVDFGNLEHAGESAGLATLKYTTQGQFLIDWGIMEIAEKNPDEIGAIKNLFMPGMMGGSFRALMQIKNAPELKENFYPESPVRISFGVD